MLVIIMPDIKTPDQLDFSSASSCWEDWRRRFMRYRSASGLVDRGQQRQIDTLIYVMGPEAEQIMTQVTVRPVVGDEDAAETLFIRTLDGFTNYFQPRDNTLHFSIVFSGRAQAADESNEEFIRALYELVTKCGWPDAQQQLMLRARILAGMRDKQLSRELQLDENVTLAQIKTKMRAKEIILRNQKAEIDGEIGGSQANVAAVARSQPAESKSSKSGQVVECRYCGRSHVSGRCPAYGKRCRKCNQFNHFEKVCRSRAKTVKTVQVESEQTSDNEFSVQSIAFNVFGLDSQNNGWFVEANVNHCPMTCQIDTGAEVSVMDVGSLKKVGIKRLKTTRARLNAYGGTNLKVVGKVNLEVHLASNECAENVLFYIVDGGPRATTLLGMPAIQSLGLIHKVGMVTQLSETSSQSIINEHECVFKGLGKLKDKLELKLKDSARPKAMPPRMVPQGIRGKLKKELERLEQEEIICRDNEPSEWLSPPVIVRKPDGTIRLCLDPQYLNSQLVRTQCSMTTATEIFSRLQGSKVFSCLDGRQGFHQIPLTHESSRLTCFVTPFGKFRFLRCPMGICNAPEIFHAKMVEIVGDIPGVEVYIDDILVHAPTQEAHDARLREVLQRCKKAGITLNQDKSVFSRDKVVFLGHELSEQGIRPSIDKMETVRNMTVPEDRKALERFLGFVNYLAKFLPHLAELTHPLRVCCKDSKEFIWESSQEEAFRAIKQSVEEAPTLSYFDATRPITLSADASAHSLGAVIMQDGKPVEFAAKSLTECQQRYSQIEKELLAVVFAVQRFKYYCYGSGQVMVETDHKPLIGIMAKDICLLSPRLAAMRLQLLSFSIELVYRPGKELVLADTLSRSCPAGTQIHEDLGTDPLLQVCKVVIQSEETNCKYAKATLLDEELTVVLRMVKEGWPTFKKGCPQRALPFWNIRLSLTTIDGLLFYGSRLVVPNSLRAEVLRSLHKAHQGVTKVLQRAESSVFWPGIRRRVEDTTMACGPCMSAERAAKSEPLISTPVPQYPFQKVGMDLFHLEGVDYLLIVDYFSKWPIVKELSVTTSGAVVHILRTVFSDWGTPEVVVSDNGPQFSARQFKQFCRDRDINPVTSSPLHPSGNGQVERVVGTVKNMIRRSIQSGADWNEGLTALRNTPVDGGLPPPSRLLQGRVLRDSLPVPVDHYQVAGYDCEQIRLLLETRQSGQKYYHDTHAGHEKSQLAAGQTVMFRTAKGTYMPGEVLGLVGQRSYEIRNDHDMVFRRNRVDIRESKIVKQPQGVDIRESTIVKRPQQGGTSPTDEVSRTLCRDATQVQSSAVGLTQSNSASLASPVARPRSDTVGRGDQLTLSKGFPKDSTNPKVSLSPQTDLSPEVSMSPRVSMTPTQSTTGRVLRKPRWLKDYV